MSDKILFEGNCAHSGEDMIFFYEDAALPKVIAVATKTVCDDSLFYADVKTAKGIIEVLSKFVDENEVK